MVPDESEEEEENQPWKLCLAHPKLRASLAPYIVPVAANDRQMVERSEKNFKVVNVELNKICDELDF